MTLRGFVTFLENNLVSLDNLRLDMRNERDEMQESKAKSMVCTATNKLDDGIKLIEEALLYVKGAVFESERRD